MLHRNTFLLILILLSCGFFSATLTAESFNNDNSSTIYEMVEFPSEGAVLKGRLYMPGNAQKKMPIVVMAHGYSATITGMTSDKYAEQYYDAGFAVLLYDHRNFGISGGEPRQQINIWTQARGYSDAIDYVETLPEIDTNRIAIWGCSMTGGVVICVGALDERVNAIVAQIPSCGDDLPPDDDDNKNFEAIRETFFSGDISSTPENTVGPIPVVSHSPELLPAMMKPMTAFRWFIEYGGRFDSGWRNWVTHVTPETPYYLSPTICVRHVTVPLLMLVAFEDEMPYCSSEITRLTYELAPGPKELHEIDGGHFGLLEYPSPLFDEASEVQVDFLQKLFLDASNPQ